MLETQLTQQLDNLLKLHDTLEQEKTCLTDKQFAALNDILFNKQKLLQTISTLDKTLSHAKNLDSIAQNETLSALKARVESQLMDCQKLNNINGKLVALSMKSNKHLMQLMTQATGRNSVTYDQKGLLQGGQLLGRDIQA